MRTLLRRGKSETPLSRVSTEDSRNLRDVRREETQSEYVARLFVAMVMGLFSQRAVRWFRVEQIQSQKVRMLYYKSNERLLCERGR